MGKNIYSLQFCPVLCNLVVLHEIMRTRWSKFVALEFVLVILFSLEMLTELKFHDIWRSPMWFGDISWDVTHDEKFRPLRSLEVMLFSYKRMTDASLFRIVEILRDEFFKLFFLISFHILPQKRFIFRKCWLCLHTSLLSFTIKKAHFQENSLIQLGGGKHLVPQNPMFYFCMKSYWSVSKARYLTAMSELLHQEAKAIWAEFQKWLWSRLMESSSECYQGDAH